MSLKSPKRVLVYRLGSIGDIVVAVPALHLIERAFPTAERRLLASYPPHPSAAPSSAVLDGSDLVHGYFRYHYGTRSPRQLGGVWAAIARWRPEVLVYLGGTRSIASARRDAAFFRLCGIRRLIGVPITEDTQFPRQMVDPLTGRTYWEPAAARLVRNIAELGSISLDDPDSWDLRLTASEHACAAAALSAVEGMPILAASLGTKMQSKDWGSDNWRSLLGQLAQQYPSHALMLCGAAEEREASDAAAQSWNRFARVPAINLCGILSPRESAATLARCRLFLGHDSGPMHLAAAVQTPVVAIFSSRNLPRVWFPYGPGHRVLYREVDCMGCNLQTCVVQQKKCILSISVEAVLAEVQQVLGDTYQPATQPWPMLQFSSLGAQAFELPDRPRV